VLVLLSGIGPVIAWRRATAANVRRAFAFPAAAAAVTLAVLLLFTRAASSLTSLLMFCFIAFTLAVIAQEFWRGSAARKVMTGEPRGLAAVRLVGRNRRRYGGYLVHVGIAVMMLGVAASSAFALQRDARLDPGESMRVGDYTVTYREPTAAVLDDRAGTGAPITLGAVLDVTRDGRTFTVRPSRNYYAGGDGGPIERFFEGESTSEVEVKWGVLGDFWAAVQPDIAALEGPIQEAEKRFGDAPGPIQATAIQAIVQSYAQDPPPAAFRVIDTPMVVWIWLGGAIVMGGALIALWPGAGARRRISSVYAARLGRELERA
jgi:cytochrome c-type biogenesis protein CcmF